MTERLTDACVSHFLTVAIGFQATHHVEVLQRILLQLVALMQETDAAVGLRQHYIDAATESADPYPTHFVLAEVIYIVAVQVETSSQVLEVGGAQMVALWGQYVETRTSGADPDAVIFVAHQAVDTIVVKDDGARTPLSLRREVFFLARFDVAAAQHTLLVAVPEVLVVFVQQRAHLDVRLRELCLELPTSEGELRQLRAAAYPEVLLLVHERDVEVVRLQKTREQIGVSIVDNLIFSCSRSFNSFDAPASVPGSFYV